VDEDSGCWVGQGSIDKDGYARIDGRGLHRAVWEILVGPIPGGLVLDHREDWGCTTRACCYPGHLKPVTPRVNVLRGRSFGAVNFRKQACGTCGSPYDLINTYWWRGRRDCRACIRRRVHEYRARKRSRYASGTP
jgi:hypothetical protein